MASSRPYILNELTWKTVRDTRYDVAVLPWGATEAHNYHLPYTTDNIQERLALRDFMDQLRGSGVETGGPAPWSQSDSHAFANQLDRLLSAHGKPS